MTCILGLDPGLRHTGWGVIRSQDNRLQYVSHGIISSNSTLTLAMRLQEIYEGLSRVIDGYQPDTAAVEEVFVNKNPSSTLKLGMARGVVLLAPAMRQIPVAEYSANKVKKAVVGAGHADKSQVEAMVRMLLPGAQGALKDAADALAVAICHAHFRAVEKKWV